MNKLTLLILCLLAFHATGAKTAYRSQENESKVSLQSLENISRCVTIPSKIKSQLSEKPVYNAPDGEKIYYARTSYGYYYDWDTFTFGKREGGISIIYAEDGNAYIHNPISGWATNSYLQGKMTDDGITVTLPQLILEEPDFDNPSHTILFYAAVMKCIDSGKDYVTYEVVEEDITFLIDAEGNISYNLSQNTESPESEMILGLCDDLGTLYFGDAAQFLNKVTLEAVEPPATLQCEEWRLYADGEYHRVNLGFDNEDVYLQNFDYIYAPDTWIKGKKEGDYITFESGQFLAETEGFFYRFLAATYGNAGYSIEPDISFFFDRDKNMMTVDEEQIMVSNPMLNSISYRYPQFMTYYNPVLKLQTGTPTSNVPQNPKFVAYLDQTEVSGMYFCEFDIYAFSTDYDPIDPSQLSFIVFIDDVAIDNFASDPRSIYFPYGFWGDAPNYMTIYQLGTNVVMYMFDGCQSIGMQLVNTTPDGEEYESALVTYNVDDETVTIEGESGVAIATTDDIVSSECYDLTGIKCNLPSKGLHIILDRHSDGTVTTRKVMVK